MVLREISEGRISGTGNLKCRSTIVGGVAITTDGTNAAVVVLKKNDSSGKVVFSISTKTPMFCAYPISLGTEDLYYDITGTGAAADIFEHVA